MFRFGFFGLLLDAFCCKSCIFPGFWQRATTSCTQKRKACYRRRCEIIAIRNRIKIDKYTLIPVLLVRLLGFALLRALLRVCLLRFVACSLALLALPCLLSLRCPNVITITIATIYYLLPFVHCRIVLL